MQWVCVMGMLPCIFSSLSWVLGNFLACHDFFRSSYSNIRYFVFLSERSSTDSSVLFGRVRFASTINWSWSGKYESGSLKSEGSCSFLPWENPLVWKNSKKFCVWSNTVPTSSLLHWIYNAVTLRNGSWSASHPHCCSEVFLQTPPFCLVQVEGRWWFSAVP